MQYLASYRQVKQGGSIYEAIKNAEMSMETAEERGYTFSELGRMFKKLGIELQNKWHQFSIWRNIDENRQIQSNTIRKNDYICPNISCQIDGNQGNLSG